MRYPRSEEPRDLSQVAEPVTSLYMALFSKYVGVHRMNGERLSQNKKPLHKTVHLEQGGAQQQKQGKTESVSARITLEESSVCSQGCCDKLTWMRS